VTRSFHDRRHHPRDPHPSGLRWINPVKIYCSAGILDFINAKGMTLHLFMDDFLVRKQQSAQ
jgi:hypothetical protein